MDVDEVLRAAFREMEPYAPQAQPDRTLQALRLSERGRFQGARIAAAAAAVLTTVAAVVVVTDHYRASVPPPRRVGAAVPAGKQPASFHGLELFVPLEWQLSNERCGLPVANTVVFEDALPDAENCFNGTLDPSITVVAMRTIGSPDGRALAALADKATTVDGTPARMGRGIPAGASRPSTVLVVPDVGVVVGVETRDRDAADSILDTAHLAKVDSLGCPDRLAAASPQRSTTGPSKTMTLAPASPTSASLCRYRVGWLARSAQLSAARAQHLADVLNRLPKGVSRAANMTVAPDICQEEAERGFLVLFGERHVLIHVSGCGDLFASNSETTSKINPELIDLVTRPLGYDGLTPGPGDLR